MKQGIAEIPELKLMGRPIGVFAFTSTNDSLNIYQVLDQLSARGWSLTGSAAAGGHSRQPDAAARPARRGRAVSSPT